MGKSRPVGFSQIINRLKIGHSRLTQSYLLSGEDQPPCASCDAPLTVKHIVLDYLVFAHFIEPVFTFILKMLLVFRNLSLQNSLNYIFSLLSYISQHFLALNSLIIYVLIMCR